MNRAGRLNGDASSRAQANHRYCARPCSDLGDLGTRVCCLRCGDDVRLFIFTAGFLGGFLLWLALPARGTWQAIKKPYWIASQALRLHPRPVEAYPSEPDELHAQFGGALELLEQLSEAHRTPSGAIQQFVYSHCIVQ